MTLPTAVPKPKKSPPKPRKPLPRSATPLKRSAIKKSGKRIPQVNARATARRHATYKRVIASDWQKELRYKAYLRSGGYCECEQCAEWRGAKEWLGVDNTEPWAIIPVWFTKGGSAPHKRFRSEHGSLHHLRYTKLGKENPAEIDDVQWCWNTCHARMESEHGTRRRWRQGQR